MVVPENPENHQVARLAFLVYFHAPSENQTDRAPILHLGGGGPGAAMISGGAYVDIEGLLRTYSPMSQIRGI